MPGFEADDVIGTIADKSKEDVVIVTGDRDILQLIDDKKNIKLYMPVVGLTNAKLYGEAEALERMGVPANEIPDYKALVGDPSDNYPGVLGIGPVTAEKLLEKYKSIDNIYTHLGEIEPNIRKKLEAKKEDAKLFHRLATIVRDVPIKVNYEDMGKWKIDSPEVINLFQKFGFKTLMERIKKVGKEIDGEKQASLF
jgi:DNA polymerase-1